MKAKVITEFKGVPDESNYPVSFKVGDTVNGRLAEVAVREGWAKSLTEKPAAKKKESAKPGSASPPVRRSRRGRPKKSDVTT
ncbi:MAG: hypothetical protein KJO47_08590 [Gammaproteobacteria bacterium]|nr:hypothetical protein [Gammaproteobacteria bacterium]